MKINSPFSGVFSVSQEYSEKHTGLDMYTHDDSEIHSVSHGTVVYADWENTNDTTQGFGRFVCIKDNDGLYHYYGHLSSINVSVGDNVSVGTVLGIQGNTGRSTGSHLHYEIRRSFTYATPETTVNPCTYTGIPNKCGTYTDNTEIETKYKSITSIVLVYDDNTTKTITL